MKRVLNILINTDRNDTVNVVVMLTGSDVITIALERIKLFTLAARPVTAAFLQAHSEWRLAFSIRT